MRSPHMGGMGKPFAVCALCVISAAFGAAIDRYLAGAIEQGGSHLQLAVSPKAAVAAPAEMNVEVLGDRVRCDFRYQELKIPAIIVSVVQTQMYGR
jgi:hypothetical protein